jgi:hypothetical protein
MPRIDIEGHPAQQGAWAIGALSYRGNDAIQIELRPLLSTTRSTPAASPLLVMVNS